MQGERRVRERKHQTRAREEEQRFSVLVWHRRAGKSHHLVLRMLQRAILSGKDDWQGAYMAPTRLQAQQIAEPYFLEYGEPLGAQYNKSQMKLTLPGVGFIQMFSGENYDRMRGLYLDDVTLDECALIPTAAWTQVISPAISDRKGSATFSGTPNGMQNLLYRQYEYASSRDDPDWYCSLLGYKDTGAVDPDEIARNRRLMTPEEFAQEFECSFSGALRGAYYAKEMQQCLSDGRVTQIKYDNSHPVYLALDLGWSDTMVCIWFQLIGSEVRILRAKAYEHTSLPDMVQDWRQYENLDQVILPHDARQHELGTGQTREEVITSLGHATSICPNQKIHEGISQVKILLKHCWFDKESTGMLREGLQSYRSKYDEVREVHSMTPEHSWASHWADAFRYMALGRPNNTISWSRQRPRLRTH